MNPPLGTEMSINFGYGMGIMVGAYIAIGVTGGHMNPAVTLAMALRGRTCWLKVLHYRVEPLSKGHCGRASEIRTVSLQRTQCLSAKDTIIIIYSGTSDNGPLR